MLNPTAADSTLNGSTIENGDSSSSSVNGNANEISVTENDSVPQLKNGDFSADEVTEEEDDEQPSVVIRKAATPVKRSSARLLFNLLNRGYQLVVFVLKHRNLIVRHDKKNSALVCVRGEGTVGH